MVTSRGKYRDTKIENRVFLRYIVSDQVMRRTYKITDVPNHRLDAKGKEGRLRRASELGGGVKLGNLLE